jgi:hypothetical protein
MNDPKRNGIDCFSKHHCVHCGRFCYCYTNLYSCKDYTVWYLKAEYFCYKCYNLLRVDGPTLLESLKDTLGFKTHWRERLEESELVEFPMKVTYRGVERIDLVPITKKDARELGLM